MSAVTMEQKREAMQRVWEILTTESQIPPCPWGCPADEHGQLGPLPEQTTPYVVYGFFGHTGTCLYVGQTECLQSRVYAHAAAWREHWFHAKEVRVLATAHTRLMARRHEAEQIRSLDPVWNIHHSPTNRRTA